MTSMLNDPTLEALLERLHAESRGQTRELEEHFSLLSRINRKQPLLDAGAKTFLADKLVALDRDKAEFCYALCRSLGAKRKRLSRLLRVHPRARQRISNDDPTVRRRVRILCQMRVTSPHC